MLNLHLNFWKKKIRPTAGAICVRVFGNAHEPPPPGFDSKADDFQIETH